MKRGMIVKAFKRSLALEFSTSFEVFNLGVCFSKEYMSIKLGFIEFNAILLDTVILDNIVDMVRKAMEEQNQEES